MFPHVCDIKDRKVVDLIERGRSGAQNSKKIYMSGTTTCIWLGGGGLSYTPSVERVVG